MKKLVFSDDSSDENQTVETLQNRFEQNRKGEAVFCRLFQNWFVRFLLKVAILFSSTLCVPGFFREFYPILGLASFRGDKVLKDDFISHLKKSHYGF